MMLQRKVYREHTQLRSPSPFVPSLPPMASPEPFSIPPSSVSVRESPTQSNLVGRTLAPSRSVNRLTSPISFEPRSRLTPARSLRAQTREEPPHPSPEDPLGPSARFPYHLDSSEECLSCRPGGPRIYDLLNVAQFGVLSWVVVNREEEMFELDEILDEDKVMQALWARWILLKR